MIIFCLAGDQLTSLINDLMSKIWQVNDKEDSVKRATITWLWVCVKFAIQLFSITLPGSVLCN